MADQIYHNTAKKSILYLAFLFAVLPGIVRAQLPNDPDVAQWSYRDVKAFDAWELATGSSDVIVAVIDNGFDTFHPELVDNVWKNEDEIPDNGIDDDHNGYIDDVWGWNFFPVDVDNDGGFSPEELKGNNDPRPDVTGVTQEEILDGSIHHGTLVAGLIGAKANNNQFGAGINWHVKLMNVKVVGNTGNTEVAQIADAIRYAVDNGADIINISLVGPAEQEDLKAALHYAYDRGVAAIAASGNDYLSLDTYPRYPICADEEGDTTEEWVLGVSAIDESHHLAQFANRGHCVDIAAPGMHISSTMRYAPRYGLNTLYGGPFSGTSFAAPFVSATAALIKGIHPEWGAKEIFDTILTTVHKSPPWDETEYTRYFGRGLVRIDKAVQAAVAKVFGFHAVVRVFGYVPASGNSDFKSGGSPPKGARAITSYTKDGVRGYVAVLPKTKKNNEVVIFNDNWSVLQRWNIAFGGGASLAVGDVAGDHGLEIIVAPGESETSIFSVYSFGGTELKSITAASRHRGVNIGLIDVKEKKQEILAVYDGSLRRFDSSFSVVQTLGLSHIKNTASVGAGDIDADGVQEYVVGSAVGDEPNLAYFEQTGEWKRTFPAYAPGYKGGVRVAVGDYDSDGKDDVIVAPESGGQPIRVWTDRSKRIAEWWPFGKTAKDPFSLVVWYK